MRVEGFETTTLIFDRFHSLRCEVSTTFFTITVLLVSWVIGYFFFNRTSANLGFGSDQDLLEHLITLLLRQLRDQSLRLLAFGNRDFADQSAFRHRDRKSVV